MRTQALWGFYLVESGLPVPKQCPNLGQKKKQFINGVPALSAPTVGDNHSTRRGAAMSKLCPNERILRSKIMASDA
jgi:hypothetical protein